MVKEVRKALSIICAVAFAGTMVFGGWYQDPKSSKQKEDILQLESNLVTVDVVATDSNGNFVRDLKREDFQLFEDNQPQKIEFFEKGVKPEQRPLAAVFALDTSGSIEPDLGQVKEQQDSAEQFMKLLDKDSEFAVLSFNNEIHILQNFTNNPDKVTAAFRKAANMGGTTHIYDAVDRSITMLKKVSKTKDGRRIRRVVILVVLLITEHVDPIEIRFV